MLNSLRTSLTLQILLALVAGAVTGLVINLSSGGAPSGWVDSYLVAGLFTVIGKVFVSLLKMLVVPLVLVSLVGGVTALGDPKSLGRIGGKALLLYLTTTAIAISIAMGLASLVNPGKGVQLDIGTANFAANAPPSLAQVLIDMVPTNPFASLANGNMLQVIVFAILLGIAITLAGEPGKRVQRLFDDFNAVVMKVVDLVMWFAPYGVFCLIAKTLSNLGLDAIGSLAAYFVTVLAALFIHALVVYPTLLTTLGRLNPLIFLSKMRSVLVFAFSTSSSNATIPVTLRAVRERLGVDNKVASFTVPLGATINMDGTAIMQGVATVFIANVYGIDLSMMDFLAVIMTATLASIGTAGVPGVGLVMLAMVLEQVGVPVEGIALIIGIDRLLDMVRTAVNVTGDATVSCIIGRSENALDVDTFNNPSAGLVRNDG